MPKRSETNLRWDTVGHSPTRFVLLLLHRRRRRRRRLLIALDAIQSVVHSEELSASHSCNKFVYFYFTPLELTFDAT